MILLRSILFGILILIIGIILPNILGEREKAHYSDELRLSSAKEHFHEQYLSDSITLAPASYYDERSAFYTFLFGEKYRKIWGTKISVPVFTFLDSAYQYKCYDLGGGQQTIGIDLQDEKGRVWTVRSIDKDQSKALHPWLRYTIIRPIIRDGAAAMNPYGAFVADDLAAAAGILHTNPRLVFIPYTENLKEICNQRMAGRLALIEEDLHKEGWKDDPPFPDVKQLVKTSDMYEELFRHENRSIDTTGYLKARLLDILISDWDRHEGQWVWALKGEVYHPIPVDRDMVFYLFDDGWINRLLLLFNDKFQSFYPEFKNVPGYIRNSLTLDLPLLKGVPEKRFVEQAEELQHDLTDQQIDSAFRDYPPTVYEKVGKQHATILKQRRSKLKIAAKEFFTAINKEY